MPNYKSNLQSNNEALNANNLDLQSLIDQANALPDAGGVELPVLTNEGIASDLMFGKQLINSEGNKVTGAFTIDSELNTQDDLIAQIQTALEGKTAGGGGSGSVEMCSGTVNVKAPTMDDFTVYALNENLQVSTITIGTTGGSFNVAKGTIFAITPWHAMSNNSNSGVSKCFGYGTGAVFVANDNNFVISYI